MNKFNLFLGSSLVFIMITFVYVGIFKDNSPSMISNTSAQMDVLNYLQYSDENLDYSANNGNTVLFFAATLWCQSCAQLEKEIISRHSEIPENITILKVDYDNDREMNSKWGVSAQHTLIQLDKNGEELNRWVGGDFDKMIEQINKV